MSNARFGLRIRSGLVRGITEGIAAIDSDALAFITAAGITDATQIGAINGLVLNLKSFGLWTKMKAIYPFVGGTASTHKWNLKNPMDLDAAFRLVFNGGWIHTINGSAPNGINAWANTFLNPFNSLTLYDTHTSFYSRTNNNANMIDLSGENSASNRIAMHIKWSDNNAYYDMYNQTTNRITYPMGSITSLGLFLCNRVSNNNFNVWRNSTKLSTNTNASSTSIPNISLALGSLNSTLTGQSFFSTRECAFASIGDGLTDTEAANFYTAVQTFQTTLGRQV